MDIAQLGQVISITVICYIIGLVAKNIEKLNDKWIPVIVGIAGGIIGAVGLYVIPSFPANNVIDAVAVGIVSGLASTGADQIFKQLR